MLENNHKIFQSEVNFTLVHTPDTRTRKLQRALTHPTTKLKLFPSAWSGSLRVICHYIPEKSLATRQNWFSLYKINVRQMQKTCWMPWTIQAVMDNVSNVRCTTTSIRWMAQVSLIVEWCALVYTRVGWTAYLYTSVYTRCPFSRNNRCWELLRTRAAVADSYIPSVSSSIIYEFPTSAGPIDLSPPFFKQRLLLDSSQHTC